MKSIRANIVLLIVSIGIIISIILVIIIHTISKSQADTLDKKFAEITVNTTKDVLNQNLISLSRYTRDYAVWNDTYTFIQDKNNEYIVSNLDDNMFSTLSIRTVLFLDTQGVVAYTKSFDIPIFNRFARIQV